MRSAKCEMRNARKFALPMYLYFIPIGSRDHFDVSNRDLVAGRLAKRQKS